MSRSPVKVLIASLGTRGDVQPYVALAMELVAQGADVVVATGEGFEAMIESAGARSRSVPINYQTLLQNPELQDALQTLRGKVRASWNMVDLQKQVARTLWDIGLEEKPDLILYNLKATIMTAVARRLNVPALPVSLQPATAPTGEFPIGLFGIPDMGRTLNRKTYELGRWLMSIAIAPIFKPVKRVAKAEFAAKGNLLDGHMPDGSKPMSLQAYSVALVPTPKDWSSEHWACGYWFTEPDPTYQPPDDLAGFLESGAPPIYLGFGSMPSKEPEKLTSTIVNALSRTGQRAILAMGWGGLAATNLPLEASGAGLSARQGASLLAVSTLFGYRSPWWCRNHP